MGCPSDMGELLQIIIIDDEPIVGKRLKQALAKITPEVEVFENAVSAMGRLEEKAFDIVITDVRMDDMDGIQILEYLAAAHPRTKVIVITGLATIELAREALVKGAFDFIAKPFKPDDLRTVISKAAASLGFSGIERKNNQ